MFRFLTALVLSTSMVTSSYAMSINDGLYYFRYKTTVSSSLVPPVDEDDDLASKTITATYVGGVGIDFSEKLPLKPEWQDDAWQVEIGSLPNGITFDPDSQTFTGKPTALQSQAVTLYGYDGNGERIARANISFRIIDLPANSVHVAIMAHTGKTFSKGIAIPSGVVVHHWSSIVAPPQGVSFSGHFVEGKVDTAGLYTVVNVGYDYSGVPVFGYYGTLQVDDGPIFPVIADDLRNISNLYEGAIWWGTPVTKITNPIGKASSVRYAFELDQGQRWPGTLRPNADPYGRTLGGKVKNFYDQAKVRVKAIDVDDTVGYSNWYQVGSLGQAGACVPASGESAVVIPGVVDNEINGQKGYQVDVEKDASTKAFSLVGGALPAGLSLDAVSGLITGKPTKDGTTEGIMIDVAFPANTTAPVIHCGPYKFDIAPAKISLSAPDMKDDYRVGDAIFVTLVPDGALIAPYSIAMEPDAVLPAGVSFDPQTAVLSGPASTIGSYSAKFTLKNGTGYTAGTLISFVVHSQLKIDEVNALPTIARYETANPLFSFSYDKSAVIGSPTLSIEPGPLPDGISLNAGDLAIVGGTRLPVGQYGPFRIRLTDDTGSYKETNDFRIDVTARNSLTGSILQNPVPLTVNLPVNQQPVSVTQAPLATNYLPLEYKLVGPDLPDGLTFDKTTGVISGTPKNKALVPGYTVLVSEISSDNLTYTSDEFSLDIKDPPPITDQALVALRGNVGGPSVTSVSPQAALTNIKTKLVGGVSAVVFDSVNPAISSLPFNAATGQISGLPTAEFNSDVTINYHDGGNRPGRLILPVAIYPYPTLTPRATSFELPRLAEAVDYDIIVDPNEGFYSVIDWALDPSTPLPTGLSFANGVVTGQTSVEEGASTIKVTGTNRDNGIKVSAQFVLNIVKRVAPTINVPGDYFKIELDETTGKVVKRSTVKALGYLKGSYVKPLIFGFASASNPDWMTISSTDGTILGAPPRIGDFPVQVRATDKELQIIDSPANTFNIRSTLHGYPNAAPGSQSITVRRGETFATTAQDVTNVVRPYAFQSKTLPSTFSLNPANGVITGRYDTVGNSTVSFNVLDAHERKHDTNYTVSVMSTERLSKPGVVSNAIGTRYDPANPVLIQFRKPSYGIGNLSYGISGDLPGTLYYKNVDPSTGLASYSGYKNGSYIGAVVQSPQQTRADVEAILSPDHLIFDPATLTLTGIPSETGTFSATLSVVDDHADAYINQGDANRVEYNASELAFTVTVSPEIDLAIENSATSETIAQYTGQSKLKTTVSNAAYGLPVSWELVSGTLPTNTQRSSSGSVLGYSGYPTVQGTYADIAWKAKDVAGREITSKPVTLIVGPRDEMTLSASNGNPRTMVVNQDDADTKISAVNAAYGPNLGTSKWQVSGTANLPPGVTFVVGNDGVTFSGTSTVLGTYSGVTIVGTDPIGTSATINMTFKVVASQQAIVLNVFDIITKAGFPIKMEPPFALGTLSTSNTYGAPRFYSYDLPAVLGLDGTTGAISGSVTTAQNLDFDLFVTDDTNRVTSQPVAVSVLPNLRLTVASTLTTQQGATAKTPILTDYALGNVAYEKGSGNWPTGLDVNPTTGALTGKVTGVGGTYAGLTIRGRDTFGGYVDTQESNAFTVTVTSTNAKPVFANVPSNKLVYGRVGTATTWKPTINDNSNKVWAYGGLTVTANYDLTQYGLTLDPDTGEISGTPTKSVIIPDLKFTVVAGNGYSDDITPFWFGIAPEKPLAFAASAPTKFIFRSKTAINQNAIPITDAVGASTFTVVGTPGGITLDKNTGALDYTGATALSTTTSKTLTITVKDDFGQTASYQPTMAVNAALTLTYAAFNTEAGSDILPQTGTVGGQLGTLSYSQATTFAGLSVNSTTGALTGKLQESDFTDGFATIQVKVTDAQDNASVTASMVVTQVARHRYWKYTWTFGAATTGNFRALTFFDENGVNSALSRVNAGTATVSGTIVSGTKTLTDILAGTGSNNISTATGVMVDFGTQDVPLVIKWRYNQIETGLAFQRGTIYLSYSDDGANWTIAGTAVTTGATLAYASNLAVKSK